MRFRILALLLIVLLFCVSSSEATKPGRTEFFALCGSGASAEIASAIEAGADVNERDEYGYTALHYAAWTNPEPEATLLLLRAGADVNAKSKTLSTPLHAAAIRNTNPEVLEVLLNAGADMNAQSEDGATPLHVAAFMNPNPDVLAALLKAGADATIRDEGGRRAVDYARDIEEFQGTRALKDLEEASR